MDPDIYANSPDPFRAAAVDVIKRQPKTGEFVFNVPNWNRPNLLNRTFLQIRKKTGVHELRMSAR